MNFLKITTEFGVVELPVESSIYHSILNSKNVSTVNTYELRNILEGLVKKTYDNYQIEIGDVSIPFTANKKTMEALAGQSGADYVNELADDNPFSESPIRKLNDMLRLTVPSSERAPTRKQIEYAGKIASVLGLTLSDSQKSSTEKISAFIDENKDDFDSVKSIFHHMPKIARGFIVYIMYHAKYTDEQILSFMEVKKKDTIVKYTEGLHDWLVEFKNYEQQLKNTLLKELDSILIQNYGHLDVKHFSLASEHEMFNNV